MTKPNNQWNSLGDFLKAKEQREKNQEPLINSQVTTPVVTGVVTPVVTPVTTPVVASITDKTALFDNEDDLSDIADKSLAISQPVKKVGLLAEKKDSDAAEHPIRRNTSGSEDRNTYLDATHTASEKSIYSVMYRETISRGVNERHFGFREVSSKTGIRSDRTVRVALQGLQAKLSIEIIAYQHGNPIGPRYRIYEPKEIIQRRKAINLEIDPQTKKITITPVATGVITPVATGGKTYGSTPVTITPVTPANSTGVNIKYINSNLEKKINDDDAALAGLRSVLNDVSRELTGKGLNGVEQNRWQELAEVLVVEVTQLE